MLGDMQYDYTVKMQTMLNNMGYGPLNVDGKWGPKTQAAFDRYSADAKKTTGKIVKRQTVFSPSSTTGGIAAPAVTGKTYTAQMGANTPWYAQLIAKYIDQRYAPASAPVPGAPARVGGAGGQVGVPGAAAPFYLNPWVLGGAALGVGLLIFATRKKS